VKKRVFNLATVLAALLLLAAAVPVVAQDKPEDMKKIIAEIVGDYEFAYQGQVMVIQFTEKDGKLFGAPVGETPEEIKPIAGKPLFFDVTTAEEGQYYELQFVRNDKGVVDKCIMNTMGASIEGIKIIK